MTTVQDDAIDRARLTVLQRQRMLRRVAGGVQ